MDPVTATALGIAGVQTLASLFGAQAAAEEAERQRKLQGTLQGLQGQQQNMQRGVSGQQMALERLIQNMTMGGQR